MLKFLEEKQDQTVVLSKHVFQHWQELVSNSESISASARNRMKQWEPQLCFKNRAAAAPPCPQYTKTRYCYASENGAATRKHNRAIAFLIKRSRPCSPNQGIEALRIDQMEATASSPKLLSPRYVVYGHVAIVFAMGRSVI